MAKSNKRHGKQAVFKSKKRTSKLVGLPAQVTTSSLWKRLARQDEYRNAVIGIRQIAELLGAKIETVLGAYTDHSVKHMDSLWQIAEKVLTTSEMRTLSAGEAFLLGASFYLHDLGMAASVTSEGSEQIKSTSEFKVALERLKAVGTSDESEAEAEALREATRALHAAKALELATEPLPGLGRYLIEDSDFRERWGHTLGKVAQSHHWTLAEVERELGAGSLRPGPDGEVVDLGYVACVLRVVDYAHINRDRALPTERALRPPIPPGSTVHWDAQAGIVGPGRDDELLVFGCTKPSTNIDSWWLFFDMCKGLDAEIRGVHDYLRGRTVSASRFSLVGVKGVEAPSVFGGYVNLPEGILPIDIRVQPDSMERVVELLGGRRIYGHDLLAPIRELIQNARDAIELGKSLSRAAGRVPSEGQIVVAVEDVQGAPVLSVSDDGVGMTAGVVCKHLVGVGSDFWNSADFFRDFGKALDAGFRPIGKFGIGFLSVFMLGEEVEVRTESRAGKRVELKLHGVGRRGELRELPATGNVGTEVRIWLKRGVQELLGDLPGVVRARAPMLGIPVLVKHVEKGERVSTLIKSGWWKSATEAQLDVFVRDWEPMAYQGRPLSREERQRYTYGLYQDPARIFGAWSIAGWPDGKPEHATDTARLVSAGGEPSYGVLVCSQGIAVGTMRVQDVTGLTDMQGGQLTVSRSSFVESWRPALGLSWVSDERLQSKLVQDLRPAVVAKLDGLSTHGMLPARIGFLRGMALIYGPEVLRAVHLGWIPVTEPPGNLIHRTKDEFVAMVKEKKCVLLAVGTGAGGAFRVASSHVPYKQLSQMLVVSIVQEEIKVGYDIRESLEREHPSGVLEGTFSDLEATTAGKRHREWEPVLTDFCVECIAESWGMNAAVLHGHKWRLNFKSDVLWADLSRT